LALQIRARSFRFFRVIDLSFVHPGFLLAGAAAAALPILIHLLLRQRARLMPIGSVRFLQNVLREHTRRRKIRQWLLLALRVLVLLALAALFARPYWDRSSIEAREREIALLIDRSASMRVASGTGSVFRDAIAEARRELAACNDNTIVHVALFDSAGVESIDVAGLAQSPKPGLAGTDYGEALAWCRDVMTVSDRPQRQVVLIADLQRSGLHRSAFDGFPAGVDLAIRDVGRAMTSNVAIELSRAVITEIRPKEPIRVRVGLHNTGALPARDLPVLLEVQGPNGAIRRRRQVSLAGGERQSLDFELEEIQTDGVYSGRFEIRHTDDLEFDNQRWLAFEARHPDRLLLIDGQEGRSVYASETYYLETALRLRGQPGESPLRSFEVERLVWEDGEGFPSLDGFRAIVLANIRRLSAIDVQRLHDYVTGGGALLMFFGDQTRPDQLAALQAAGLFSGRINADAAFGPWRVDGWDETHPALQAFRDPRQADLRRLSFERMFEIEGINEPDRTTGGSSPRVLIRAGGRPLLVEHHLGQGKALYFATAADRQWSNWPQERLYVPLIRELAAYLTGQRAGQPLVEEIAVGVDGKAPGVHRRNERWLVCNTEPAESLLERVTESEFRATFGLAERDRRAIAAELASVANPPKGAQRPNESWRVVVWLLFAMLTGEMLLASRVHA